MATTTMPLSLEDKVSIGFPELVGMKLEDVATTKVVRPLMKGAWTDHINDHGLLHIPSCSIDFSQMLRIEYKQFSSIRGECEVAVRLPEYSRRVLNLKTAESQPICDPISFPSRRAKDGRKRISLSCLDALEKSLPAEGIVDAGVDRCADLHCVALSQPSVQSLVD